MKLRAERSNKVVSRLGYLLLLALMAGVPAVAQNPPVVANSLGYINGTALTTHTSGAFNTTGASTLVAFVSTNNPWSGLPVAIGGVSDNKGNTWSVLSGPTTFVGSSFTLVSAIYYVNQPATSATHTVTVSLTNPAPLVFHVFAVSGSDVTNPPISSPITDPGAGATSTSVITAPINVATNSLLLAWVKNETNATAAALGGFTLDAQQSTSFLWAESQTTSTAGSYSGQFQYDSATGWQTAVVGLQPQQSGPIAFSQSVTTKFETPINITLTASAGQGPSLVYSVLSEPNHGTLAGIAPNLTYTPATDYVGQDTFTFNVNDGTTYSNTATVSVAVQGPVNVVSSIGYINGTPLTTHTSASFNTTGASTLVAFVSSHPSWNGMPVNIVGISDSAGNTWKLLTGPSTFAGSSFTLMSAIYYVNQPTTSAADTITVSLTNPAPLVFHVVAASGADITGPPIVSAIADPGTGMTSSNVTSATINVAKNSLLLGWTKNETGATATALGNYTLDAQQSTSFLWAEFQPASVGGSYSSQFAYDSAIGWQTAVVGLQPPGGPPAPTFSSTPSNPTTQTTATFSFTDTQAGVILLCQLDGSGFSTCSSPTSYSSLSQGAHTFSVKAEDSAGNQSSPASFTWTINTTAPPAPTITSFPANPTNQTSASFSFSDSQAGVSFLCQLDGSTFAACSSPATYSSLAQGSHTFSVTAQDSAGNISSATSFTWTINATLPPPPPTITSSPTNPTNQTSATFGFSDSQPGVSFVCQLDSNAFSACSSPATYSALTLGGHSFSVKAQDSAGNLSTAAVFTWTIGSGPGTINSLGYINGTALTTHTSGAFNTTGASALVAFVSTNNPWSGLPVAIGGVSDNKGNTWSVLSGPTTFVGSSFTLVSAIYYVNQPATSATHTVTVSLTNPAPLVFHVFAVSGSDVTNPPISSPITDPGAGATSASVTTAPINVAANSLLLAWVKNETNATAAALGGFTLDAQQSTSFLWAESQTTSTAGSYSGQFQYNPAIGWQTAIVGFQPPGVDPPPAPTLLSTPPGTTNQTSASFSFSDTQAGVSFLCQLDGSTFAACSSPATYSSLAQGSHTFAVKAQDSAGNQSSATSFTWTINTTAPPAPSLTSTPANPTNQTSASFSFSDTQAGVSFLCQLDGSTFAVCTSPAAYSSLAQGSHTFAVKAQDSAGNQSSATSFTWTINTTAPPAPSLTSTPANPTNQTSASFSFSDTQAGVSFLCQLDSSTFAACTSPASYSSLAQGSHAFSVKAQDSAGNQSSAAGFTWTINTTAPPAPSLTSTPANPTNQTSASFGFSDSQTGVSFLCQLDGSTFAACSSPAAYFSLAQGSHTFSVNAQDSAGNQSSATSFTWAINTTPPPSPTITSTPANPTNQTGASFSFSDSQVGVTFLCQLDSGSSTACTSPKTYSGVSQGTHTFALIAQDSLGNKSTATSFAWTIDTTAPPSPTIISAPANPTNQTSASFTLTDSDANVSFVCQLDGGPFSACSNPATYSTLTSGGHTFAVKARDLSGNVSGPTKFSWTIDTTAPPAPAITSKPANPTNQTSASFSFSDSQRGATFLCQLDASAFSACASPANYSNLTQGSHTFSVLAQDSAGNKSAPTSFTWTIGATAPPVPTITSTPANPTNQTSASFSFSDTQTGVTFVCQLDGSTFNACTSPITYSSLGLGTHTFSVKAKDSSGNLSTASTFTWTINSTAPPTPTITSTPANPTNQTSASFSFSDPQTGVSFLCQLDAGAFGACSSPTIYIGLIQGSHTFSVKAQDSVGNQSGTATFSWVVDTTVPPVPTITSTATSNKKASFQFTDSQAGVSFLCQLDARGFTLCSSPISYSGLASGSHTFSVKAKDSAGNLSAAASFTWTN